MTAGRERERAGPEWTPDGRAAVDAYASFFETLAPDTLSGLRALVTPDVRFRDPFNDVAGVDAFEAVFRHMFETVKDPRFVVRDRAFGGDGRAYLLWTFAFAPAGRREPWTIEGMSELRVVPGGLVRAHLDHWDAASQLYARLPVLGPLLRLVARRVSAPVPRK